MTAPPRRALVLGASGLLGRALCRALADAGSAVVAADSAAVDVRDAAAVDAAVAGCDAVFHLAGRAVEDAAADAVDLLDVNVMGTVHVLDACRRHGTGRLVVAGSAAAYEASASGLLGEDVPLEGRGPYAASKACADVATRAYAASYGLPAVVVRLSNVYGPGDRHPSRLVPEVLAALRDGRAPRLRSDGTPPLDLLHVDDAAAALLAAGAHAAGAAAGLALNAGAGEAHTVREVVDLLLELTGAGVTPSYAPAGPRPAAARVLDVRRIRALTGWAPRYDLRAGLAATVASERR